MLVERAEISDALFMLNADEVANSRLLVDRRIQPPASIVRLEHFLDRALSKETIFKGLYERSEPQHGCFVADFAPCAPSMQAVLGLDDTFTLLT